MLPEKLYFKKIIKINRYQVKIDIMDAISMIKENNNGFTT